MFYLCVAFHGLPLFPSFLPIRDDIHARACRTNNNSKVNFLICHPETPQRILLLISFVAFICLNRLHSLNRDSVVVGKHLFAVLCVLNWTTMYYPPPSHKIVKKSGRRNEVASHSFCSLCLSLSCPPDRLTKPVSSQCCATTKRGRLATFSGDGKIQKERSSSRCR